MNRRMCSKNRKQEAVKPIKEDKQQQQQQQQQQSTYKLLNV